jgi:hypothetical protein
MVTSKRLKIGRSGSPGRWCEPPAGWTSDVRFNRPVRSIADLLAVIRYASDSLKLTRTLPVGGPGGIARGSVALLTDCWDLVREFSRRRGWYDVPERPPPDAGEHYFGGHVEPVYTHGVAIDALWELEQYLGRKKSERGSASAPVATPAQPLPTLNDLEETIVEALGTDRLTGEQIARKTRCQFNSNFKSTLARLVVRDILVKRSPGYELLDKRLLIKKASAVS